MLYALTPLRGAIRMQAEWQGGDEQAGKQAQRQTDNEDIKTNTADTAGKQTQTDKYEDRQADRAGNRTRQQTEMQERRQPSSPAIRQAEGEDRTPPLP